MIPASSALAAFTPRRQFPYVHGIYLAVNAIADARVLVDGPNCAFFKAEHVAMTHDFRSTLLDVGGVHRVANPDLHADRMVVEHDAHFGALLARVAGTPGAGVVLVAALPMASITGPDYERLVAAVKDPVAPIVVLPQRSLDRVWLDGYADTLRALAASLDLPGATPDPCKVAIVGHFFDRNEADQTASVAEMRRLVEAVGLAPVSVWLDGGPVASLRRAAEAGVLLALPHGRDAADALAARTGARVVPVDVPFGLAATDAFLRALGAATGREEAAEAAVDAGHALVAPWWEWLIPRRFAFLRFGFAGDPWMMPGFCDLAATLGASVRVLVAYSRRIAAFEPDGAVGSRLPVAPVWEPRLGETAAADLVSGLDLLVANAAFLRETGGRARAVEFGYPSRTHHCCFDAPFLGYRGALAFVDRLSNALGDRPGLADE
ncbi:MAG: hypothetical protein FJ087_03850 [Deltaproteobacteria bacterium]|nr:hypothetical protein [Deltaproteobacteria bacterium]